MSTVPIRVFFIMLVFRIFFLRHYIKSTRCDTVISTQDPWVDFLLIIDYLLLGVPLKLTSPSRFCLPYPVFCVLCCSCPTIVCHSFASLKDRSEVKPKNLLFNSQQQIVNLADPAFLRRTTDPAFRGRSKSKTCPERRRMDRQS